MTLHPIVRLVLLVIAAGLLLFCGWTGITGGVHQIDESRTAGQIAQTVMQFAYGLFAVLSLVTAFWGRRWNRAMLVAWTLSVTFAGGLAPVVWGGTSILIGFLAGAACFLVALGIAWLLRIGVNRGAPA